MRSLVLLLISCLTASSLVSAQVSGPLNAVSTTPLPNNVGGAGSYSPSFSANGRFLVFTSRANNLVTNDSNAIWLDVFVRDLISGAITLVSVNADGTGGGNGNSFNPVISSNGQFIAFESAASNLVAGDTNGANDVFVRDLLASTTSLVSVSANGATSGNGVSRFPVISANGRRIAFESTAADLTLDDTNSLKDVFVRDLPTGNTILASKGAQTPTNSFESPSINADGQWTAFTRVSESSFTDPNRRSDVYVFDFDSGEMILASSNLSSQFLIVRAINHSISSDGRFVVLESTIRTNTAFGFNATQLYLHQFNLQTLATTMISSNLVEEGFPEMTPDGRFVAFVSRTNVFVWDRQTGSNTLVSADLTGTNAANGTSLRPVLTPDGSTVAFLSDASNLTTNGGNGQSQLYVRDLVAGVMHLVSVNLDGQPTSSLSGVVPSITADGNQVAFWSTDERLVPDDQNKDADVFLRDLNAGTTVLIAARVSSLPSKTGPGFIGFSGDSIGADGRFVVLSALGSTLVGGETQFLPHVVLHDQATGTNLPVDTLDNPHGRPIAFTNLPFPANFMARFPVLSANGRYAAYVGQNITNNPTVDQVYVRDLQSQTNWLASRGWDGSGAGNAKSFAPSISGDGRWVAFQSDAANLVATDTNGRSDVFVRDLAHYTNLLVSMNLSGSNGANNFSTNPIISRDGRWVVFQSRATDLATNAFNSQYFQLFVRDLFSNKTAMISKGANGVGLVRDSSGATFNPGSSLILFRQSTNQAFLYDLSVQTSVLVCSNCFAPVMSADGRWVAYEILSGTNQIRDIVLLDRQTGVTNLVSINRDGTGGGSGSSTSPAISFDGRYVVFASRAANLVDNDTNGWTDIFVRDRVGNTTILGSVNRPGDGSANSASAKPVLGADGRTVAFQSFSSDLVEGDFNNARDVFVLRLEAGDSDGDGMNDDWELAYFGNLTRNGDGDYDGDGHTDSQEFLAGTDPTNTGSLLRVLTITAMSGGTTILWSATPGKSYRVQFKTNVNDPGWTDLPGLTTATGSSASRVDDSGGLSGQRFYRVVLVP